MQRKSSTPTLLVEASRMRYPTSRRSWRSSYARRRGGKRSSVLPKGPVSAALDVSDPGAEHVEHVELC